MAAAPLTKLSWEFLNLLESILTCGRTGPTPTKGHSLDLVLSHGIENPDIKCVDPFFSDHQCLMFNIVLPNVTCRPVSKRKSRILN